MTSLLLLPLLLSPGVEWSWDPVEHPDLQGYTVCFNNVPNFEDPIACLVIPREVACNEEGYCSDQGMLCLDRIRPVEGSPVQPDLTQHGEAFARVSAPIGGGSKNLGIIRDLDMPEVGSSSDKRQYDTYAGGNTSGEDWIGYLDPQTRTYASVIFQEGKHFSNGGWFETLTVQVRRGGEWVSVSGLISEPPYAGNNEVNYETYEMSFAPIKGEGIRLYGSPGGSAAFISVGELRVYGPPELKGPVYFDIQSY